MVYKVYVSTEAVVMIEAPNEEEAIAFAWKNVGGEAFCDDPEITGVDMLGVAEDQDTPAEYRVAAQKTEESGGTDSNSSTTQLSNPNCAD